MAADETETGALTENIPRAEVNLKEALGIYKHAAVTRLPGAIGNCFCFDNCKMKGDTMPQAKTGDTVKVHCTGKLDDGTTFMTSVGREPVRFTIGRDNILADVEEAVIGMNTGQSKTVNIPAESAYGPYREDLQQTMDRSMIPAGMTPQPGQKLKIIQKDGQEVMVTITDFSESSVTLDANHPLAGQDLTFDIELIEIA